MCIDPRVGGRLSQDISIFLKLQYLNSKQMRLLELMYLTDFLVRPHNVLAMEPTRENPETRRGPAQHFLNNEKHIWKEMAALAQQKIILEKN